MHGGREPPAREPAGAARVRAMNIAPAACSLPIQSQNRYRFSTNPSPHARPQGDGHAQT